MKIKKFGILAAMSCMLLLTACGSSGSDNLVTGQYYDPSREESASQETEQAEGTQTEAEAAYSTDIFLITDNDMQAECLILEQLASGKQYMYYYSVTTRFLDKYGNHTTVSDFSPGRIINIGKKDEKGRLLEARISDAAWEYPDVTRYSIDEERGVFRIADTNYSFDEDVFIHSDGMEQKPEDLTELDTLCVVGIGRKILSVSVTTGHGKLKLENTELFEGSFIQIGSKIFSEITPGMSMELPEGTYMVAVANNGYGGSTEIEVLRGQETALDLDTLKGDGPKFGSILFAVDVEGATIRIDGETVDYSKPVSIQYGIHTLNVTADSYEPYSKKLFVNSKEATIVIGLSGTGTGASGTAADAEAADTKESTTDTGNAAGNTQDAGSLAGSLAGSQSGSSASGNAAGGAVSGATSEAELDAIVDSLLDKNKEDGDSASDYLSTIAELLSALGGKN